MAEWEKRNGIDLRAKKARLGKRRKSILNKNQANKENQSLTEEKSNVSSKIKKKRSKK